MDWSKEKVPERGGDPEGSGYEDPSLLLSRKKEGWTMNGEGSEGNVE